VNQAYPAFRVLSIKWIKSNLEGAKYSDVFIHQTEVREEDIFKASIGFGVWVQADVVKDQTLVTISQLTYKQVHATCDPM
jgi:hypothetical protein